MINTSIVKNPLHTQTLTQTKIQTQTQTQSKNDSSMYNDTISLCGCGWFLTLLILAK